MFVSRRCLLFVKAIIIGLARYQGCTFIIIMISGTLKSSLHTQFVIHTQFVLQLKVIEMDEHELKWK